MKIVVPKALQSTVRLATAFLLGFKAAASLPQSKALCALLFNMASPKAHEISACNDMVG